jgi:hypothetical protein
MLDLDQIYKLLPAVYRIRDADIATQSRAGLDPTDQQELKALLATSGPLPASDAARLEELKDKAQRGPLKSLMAILAEQVEALEESLLQSYDDLYIETCQEWVVPYIGDLVGVQGLWDSPDGSFSLRAAIADTISNRRRKGTVPALETLAHDVTGWDARAVEYFQLLATTQFMNHIRPGNLSFADVRKANWQMLGTPFDASAHRADVRNIEKRLGKYNIPNIGIFLWRIAEQRLESSPALPVDKWRFCFDAIGRDTQLFTKPATEQGSSQRATPLNVPMPINRWMMLANKYSYYGARLSIYIDDSSWLSPPGDSDICVCDLSDKLDASGNVTGWAHQPQNVIGIDPVLGRIAFPAKLPPPENVHVDYCYGFMTSMGGGSYSRPGTGAGTPDITIRIPADKPTIQAALDYAATELAGQKNSATIEISNNEYFLETPNVVLGEGKTVELRGKDGNRPVLVLSGDMLITGDDSSVFQIDGLLIAGGSVVIPKTTLTGVPNLLSELQISNCTLAPCDIPNIISVSKQVAVPRIRVEAVDVSLTIDSSILGSMRSVEASTCTLTNSIVDAQSEVEIAFAALDSAGPGAALIVTNCTIIGKVHSKEIVLASNTIFVAGTADIDSWAAPVIADQLQQGCVRFSYVPANSRVPRRYRCQPVDDDPTPVFPAFTSLKFGDPAYCQLAQQSGPEILEGADDQSEMGVFHDVHQPQRIGNLRISLQDYLRFGLQAGVFYAS